MAIYVGKSGHVITLATGQDITACTKLAMVVARPDGTSVEWTATPSSTAGSIEYIIQGSDIPDAGQYFIQAYLEWILSADAQKIVGDLGFVPVLAAEQP